LDTPSTLGRIRNAIALAIPKSIATIWWLVKIILPISFAVSLLLYYGIIAYIAHYLTPVFSLIGLPGEAAIVFISSIFLTLYAPIAILSSLALDMREITILALMCLISHNLLVESAIQKKTGSSAILMFSLRIVMSFFAAFILNLLLPAHLDNELIIHHHASFHSLQEMLQGWFIDSVGLVIKMSLIITGLMILQNILKEFKIINLFSKVLSPLMKAMGMSERSSFLWLVSQLIGLTYGSAIMIDEVKKNEISAYDANLLNYHIAINHSLLEDTMLFVAIGVPPVWIIAPRFLIAIVLVWMVRLILSEKRR
jgi:hypothetical protein